MFDKNKNLQQKKIMNRLNNAYFLFLFIIFALLFSTSCQKDCFKSAGEIDSIVIELKQFDKIYIYDLFDVEIKQDTFYEIKIITNSTILNNIYVDNDTQLVVKDNNKCYLTRDYKIKRRLIITVPEIKELIFFNASNFYSADTLYFNRFMFKALGKIATADFKASCNDHLFISLWNITGDVYVQGNATFLDILNHGNAYVDAYDLDAEYVIIEHRSTGDIKVDVNNKLIAELFDIGNLYYKGFPAFDTAVFGEGKIIDDNLK